MEGGGEGWGCWLTPRLLPTSPITLLHARACVQQGRERGRQMGSVLIHGLLWYELRQQSLFHLKEPRQAFLHIEFYQKELRFHFFRAIFKIRNRDRRLNLPFENVYPPSQNLMLSKEKGGHLKPGKNTTNSDLAETFRIIPGLRKNGIGNEIFYPHLEKLNFRQKKGGIPNMAKIQPTQMRLKLSGYPQA